MAQRFKLSSTLHPLHAADQPALQCLLRQALFAQAYTVSELSAAQWQLVIWLNPDPPLLLHCFLLD
jgi:hypothetical protein